MQYDTFLLNTYDNTLIFKTNFWLREIIEHSFKSHVKTTSRLTIALVELLKRLGKRKFILFKAHLLCHRLLHVPVLSLHFPLWYPPSKNVECLATVGAMVLDRWLLLFRQWHLWFICLYCMVFWLHSGVCVLHSSWKVTCIWEWNS